MDEMINEFWCIHAVKYYSAIKMTEVNYWSVYFVLQLQWAWKTLCWMREARPKRPHLVWFHSYEISKTCKSIETECGLVARGWESVERGATVEWVLSFILECWECFGTRQRCWLHNIVNVLDAVKLLALEWFTLCYMNNYNIIWTCLNLIFAIINYYYVNACEY